MAFNPNLFALNEDEYYRKRNAMPDGVPDYSTGKIIEENGTRLFEWNGNRYPISADNSVQLPGKRIGQSEFLPTDNIGLDERLGTYYNVRTKRPLFKVGESPINIDPFDPSFPKAYYSYLMGGEKPQPQGDVIDSKFDQYMSGGQSTPTEPSSPQNPAAPSSIPYRNVPIAQATKPPMSKNADGTIVYPFFDKNTGRWNWGPDGTLPQGTQVPNSQSDYIRGYNTQGSEPVPSSQTVGPVQPAAQPQQIISGTSETKPLQPKDDVQKTFDDYMDIFTRTLEKPNKDTKGQKRNATVAAVNALGQMLRVIAQQNRMNEVDSPAFNIADPSAFRAMERYEKINEQYRQDKDKYDERMRQATQDAFKYAYMDEKDRTAYQRALEEEQRQNAEWNRRFGVQNEAATDADLRNFDQQKELVGMQQDWQKELAALNHKYNMGEIYARMDAQTKQNAGEGMRKVIEEQMKLAGENVPVIDPKTGKSLVIPKDLYFDLAAKIAQNPSDPTSQSLVDALGPDYEQNKIIINTLIAAEWSKYYDPVYDAGGNFIGYNPKGTTGGGTPGSWTGGGSAPTQQTPQSTTTTPTTQAYPWATPADTVQPEKQWWEK